jgi:GDPmannose 4,6-dehydratase
MLQQEAADTMSSRREKAIRELLEKAFLYVGLDWRKHMEIDQRYYRPAEVDLLIGDRN